jgi:cytochrome c biogenesis protein CcmG/thiol:disulfide interchange protein DsbE
MTRNPIFLIAAVLTLSGCGGEQATPNRGDRAPAFESAQLAGPVLRYPQDLAARAVIVRFWADWCPHCSKEMKDIEPVVERLASEGVTFLAVNTGQDRAAAQAFATRLGIHYPILLDEEAAIGRTYGVKALPATFFIRPDGRIHNKLLGEANAATFERLARELLPATRGRP